MAQYRETFSKTTSSETRYIPVLELFINYINLHSKFCDHFLRFGHKQNSCAVLQHRPLEDIYNISTDFPFPSDDFLFIDDIPVQIWNPRDNFKHRGETKFVDDFLQHPGVQEAYDSVFGRVSTPFSITCRSPLPVLMKLRLFQIHIIL